MNTKCLTCGDDYGDVADECLAAGVCADCRDNLSDPQDLLDAALRIDDEQ